MSASIAARGPRGDMLQAPAVRRPAGAGRKARKRSWLMGWFASAARRPGRTLILLAFTAATAAILLNATLFQRARHPAPILSQPQTAPAHARRAEKPAELPPVPVAPAATPAQPVPPVRQQTRTAEPAQPVQRPPQAVAVQQAARTAAAPAQVQPVRATPRDPIADLINGDLRPPADVKPKRN